MQIQIHYSDRMAKRNLAKLREAVTIGTNLGVQRATTIISRMIRNHIRYLAPVRTGRMRRNLTTKRTKLAPDRYVIEVTIQDRSAFYAFIVNAGYPRGRHKGFIEAAFKHVEPQLRFIVEQEVALYIRVAIAQAGITPPSS